MPEKSRIIMGIDPGTIVMGYGIIRIGERKDIELLTMGTVRLGKQESHYAKLKHIFEQVSELIEVFNPDEIAIEAPFFKNNVQSMLKLGRAQGAAMIAALHHDLPITEYVPMRVKQAITGSGAASKEQVAGMLQRYLKIAPSQISNELDATDGLAVALCHYFLTSSTTQTIGDNDKREQKSQASKNWSDFIRQNPQRIKQE